MFLRQDRIKQEKGTVEAMIRLYCGDQHQRRDELCSDCRELLEYAWSRLERCPYQEGKTTCAKCPVHCYRPDMREKIRSVMRYSGPRILYRHPMLALLHLIHGIREKPVGRREDRNSNRG